MIGFKEFIYLNELDAKGIVDTLNGIAKAPELAAAIANPRSLPLVQDLVTSLKGKNVAQIAKVVSNAAAKPENQAVFANAKKPSDIINQVTAKLGGNTQQFQQFVSKLNTSSLEMLNQAIQNKNFNMFIKTLDPKQQQEFFNMSLLVKNSPQVAQKLTQAAIANSAKKTPAAPAGTAQQAAGSKTAQPSNKPAAPSPANAPRLADVVRKQLGG